MPPNPKRPYPQRQFKHDLRGRNFGRWTVQDEPPSRTKGNTVWGCLCSCGVQRPVTQNALLNGSSRSCGCAVGEITGKRATKHGQSKSLAYESWHSMIQRCHNLNAPEYKNYGARGISVCKESTTAAIMNPETCGGLQLPSNAETIGDRDC